MKTPESPWIPKHAEAPGQYQIVQYLPITHTHRPIPLKHFYITYDTQNNGDSCYCLGQDKTNKQGTGKGVPGTTEAEPQT